MKFGNERNFVPRACQSVQEPAPAPSYASYRSYLSYKPFSRDDYARACPIPLKIHAQLGKQAEGGGTIFAAQGTVFGGGAPGQERAEGYRC